MDSAGGILISLYILWSWYWICMEQVRVGGAGVALVLDMYGAGVALVLDMYESHTRTGCAESHQDRVCRVTPGQGVQSHPKQTLTTPPMDECCRHPRRALSLSKNSYTGCLSYC